jgi:hypothetical protein
MTKTKGAFTSDMALLKLVYLATQNIQKKWNSPLHNWSLTTQQLYIKFGDRIPLDLELRSNENKRQSLVYTPEKVPGKQNEKYALVIYQLPIVLKLQ